MRSPSRLQSQQPVTVACFISSQSVGQQSQCGRCTDARIGQPPNTLYIARRYPFVITHSDVSITISSVYLSGSDCLSVQYLFKNICHRVVISSWYHPQSHSRSSENKWFDRGHTISYFRPWQAGIVLCHCVTTAKPIVDILRPLDSVIIFSQNYRWYFTDKYSDSAGADTLMVSLHYFCKTMMSGNCR